MGLTESNQSKISFWGATRSKSTSQFIEGRSYEGRPRQAATLPARPVSHDRNSPILLSSGKKEENLFNVVRGRPPDRAKQRNRSLQREPTAWKEAARTVPPVAVSRSVERKKNRQSDPLLDLSASPLNLVPNLKGRGCFALDKHDSKIPPCTTPYYNSSSGGAVSPQPRPTAIYISEEKNTSNRVPRTSFRRSRRHDSSCSRKEGVEEDFAASSEKETQTFSPSVSFIASPVDRKSFRSGERLESARSSERLESIRSSEVIDSAKQLGQESHRGRRRKATAKTSDKTSSSVPATPNALKSDPYICLYYSNSINREPYKENKNRDNEPKTDISCPPVYSEARFYVPNEGVVSADRSPTSPINKRSQILIKVENSEMSEVDNFESQNWNSGAIEVCSNVWFESKTRKNGNVEDGSLNGQSTQEAIQSRYVKVDPVPLNSYACNEIRNDQQSRNVNEKELNSQVITSSSMDTNIEDINLEISTSTSRDDSRGEKTWVDESKYVLKDNSDTACRYNVDSDSANEKDSSSSDTNDVSMAMDRNTPITFRSLRNRCHAVPELWLADCNEDNEHEIVPEDKAIPIPSFDASNPLVTHNVECLKQESLDASTLSEIEKNVCEATSQRNGKPRDADDKCLEEEKLNVSLLSEIEKNAREATSQLSLKSCNTDGNPVHSLLTLPEGVLSDFAKRATLPSVSPSHSQLSSEHTGWIGDPRHHPEMLRRKTIHGLDVDIFPVLRLPKSESQPRLVDVLRRKTERNENGDSQTDSERRCSTQFQDPLLAEPAIGTGLKYSPLDENILYITEDEYDKSAGRHLMNYCGKLLKPHSNKDLSHSTESISAANARNAPVVDRDTKEMSFATVVFTDSKRTTTGVSDQKLDENRLTDVKDERATASGDPFSLESLRFSSVRATDKDEVFAGHRLPFKSQTLPTGKRSQKKRKQLKKFFSLKLKASPSKSKSSFDCSLTCHEQCQNVVSLDCKTASSDDECLLEDDFGVDRLPDEDDTLDTNDPIDVGYPEEDVGETKEVEEKEESEAEREGWEKDEEDPSEEEEEVKEEEEKHEEEKQEKEIIEEQEWSTLRKLEESSTLRRTVYRIQSQAVDSTKIEEWVQKCPLTNVGLQIAKENDGGYRGCLRIHLNLSRPINIVAGTRPPSIYDILQEDRTMEKTLTSFYMPRDAVKAIHITSKTTTREVIVALLRKFKVVDNPHKFALYERTYDTGQSMRAKLRRLSDSECPLVLAIAWNAQGITNKRLVLQENDTADIQWEAFSLPELDNFLRILDREEGEYKNQIKDKYSLLRQRIQSQLARIAPVNT